MTDKSDERKALEELVACDDEDVWDEYTTGPANRKRAEQAWANARAVLATAPVEPPKDGEVAALIEQLEAIQPGFDGCITGHALAQKAAAMLRRLNPTLPDTLPGQCPRCGEFARLSAPVPAQEWIPVGERLPESEQFCAVYAQHAMLNDTWPAKWDSKNQCFDAGGGWFELNEITHWMPLPPPPAADK